MARPASDHREVITIGTTKTLIAAATASVALAGIPTAASAASTSTTTPSAGLVNAYDTVYQRVEKADGTPGRNIAEDGVREGGEARPATRSEVVASLTTLRRMHVELRPDSETAQASLQAPTTGSPLPAAVSGQGSATPAPATAGSSASQSAPAAGGTSAGGGLDGVAQCESGGDPSAVSPDGQYRGKYQFDQQTWNSVGGSGDPAAASEAEQDQRASQLQSQRGSNPWPVCGG